MARRFFFEREIEIGEEVIVTGEEARHIMVLRHKVGDSIIVNDKVCRIESVSKQGVSCRVMEEAVEKGVPNTKVTLFQALLKSDKMEYVIQKSVELGVYKVCPFSSKNVVVKLDEKDRGRKVERWNKISVEASKQCGRSDIVEIDMVCDFSKMIDKLSDFEVVIIAYENETNNLKKVIKDNINAKNIAIIVGAEGGFDKSEVLEVLKQENTVSVSLGERILRAETASLNLLSILMYEFEA